MKRPSPSLASFVAAANMQPAIMIADEIIICMIALLVAVIPALRRNPTPVM
nr:MAG TPA: hypothetical protein [Caudoviricetes sp.]